MIDWSLFRVALFMLLLKLSSSADPFFGLRNRGYTPFFGPNVPPNGRLATSSNTDIPTYPTNYGAQSDTFNSQRYDLPQNYNTEQSLGTPITQEWWSSSEKPVEYFKSGFPSAQDSFNAMLGSIQSPQFGNDRRTEGIAYNEPTPPANNVGNFYSQSGGQQLFGLTSPSTATNTYHTNGPTNGPLSPSSSYQPPFLNTPYSSHSPQYPVEAFSLPNIPATETWTNPSTAHDGSQSPNSPVYFSIPPEMFDSYSKSTSSNSDSRDVSSKVQIPSYSQPPLATTNECKPLGYEAYYYQVPTVSHAVSYIPSENVCSQGDGSPSPQITLMDFNAILKVLSYGTACPIVPPVTLHINPSAPNGGPDAPKPGPNPPAPKGGPDGPKPGTNHPAPNGGSDAPKPATNPAAPNKGPDAQKPATNPTSDGGPAASNPATNPPGPNGGPVAPRPATNPSQSNDQPVFKTPDTEPSVSSIPSIPNGFNPRQNHGSIQSSTESKYKALF